MPLLEARPRRGVLLSGAGGLRVLRIAYALFSPRASEINPLLEAYALGVTGDVRTRYAVDVKNGSPNNVDEVGSTPLRSREKQPLNDLRIRPVQGNTLASGS